MKMVKQVASMLLEDLPTLICKDDATLDALHAYCHANVRLPPPAPSRPSLVTFGLTAVRGLVQADPDTFVAFVRNTFTVDKMDRILRCAPEHTPSLDAVFYHLFVRNKRPTTQGVESRLVQDLFRYKQCKLGKLQMVRCMQAHFGKYECKEALLAQPAEPSGALWEDLVPGYADWAAGCQDVKDLVRVSGRPDSLAHRAAVDTRSQEINVLLHDGSLISFNVMDLFLRMQGADCRASAGEAKVGRKRARRGDCAAFMQALLDCPSPATNAD